MRLTKARRTLFGRRKSNSVSSSSSTSSSSSNSVKSWSARSIEHLPQTVVDRIHAHLRDAYTDQNNETCESCVVRNVAATVRVCRGWRERWSRVLYTRIYIAGADAPGMRKRMKMAYGARVALLARTLQSRPELAAVVEEVSLPEVTTESVGAEATIAALIECCPNLQRLKGVHAVYTGETASPIHTALASRRELREHLWLVAAAVPLQYSTSEAFADLHRGWRNLETLVIHGYTRNSGGGGMNHLAFTDVFANLPRLRKLMIARFHAYEFDDNTLQALPAPLTHLRLGKLPGVTENGLIKYARSPAAQHLRSLSLLELDLLNLSTVTTLLQVLPLVRFTLLQTTSPQPGMHGAAKPPVIASESLEYLHWDVLIPGPATKALARGIYHGHLPALRRLRAPADHSGVLQAVCRPVASFLQPFDLSLVATPRGYSRLLPLARIEAERRILDARESAFVKFVLTPPASEADEGVYDWMGWTGSNRVWRWSVAAGNEEQRKSRTVELAGGFLGNLKSSVTYSLDADVEGSVDAVCRVGDLVARFGGGGGFCEGWGRIGSVRKRDSIGRTNWWHEKRARKRREEDMGLDILF